MNKIRVVVTFKDDLERITVDNVDMDISIIKNKAIPEWFEPSNGRDGWRGLIEEITDRASDDSGELAFEFNGNANAKEVFEKSLKEYGYSCITEARSEDEIIDDCFEEAERLVRQGNFERAIEQYETAANAGSVEAEYLIADTIINKYFFEKDIELTDSSMTELSEKVIKYYTLAAEHGHPDAQYMMGALYWDGDVLGNDENKATEWFGKAAEQGHSRAQYELGECYKHGYGVEQNIDRAMEWYEKSAEQGDSDAQFAYVISTPVTEDCIEKKTNFLIQSAEQGNPEAQFLLGVSYQTGVGVEVDLKKAMEWYEASAEQGLPDAIYQLGECYYEGDCVEKDYEKAISYFNEAADIGYSSAFVRLGDCYFFGKGVEENRTIAFDYYKKASKMEDTEGIYGEALCYFYGQGVCRDTNIAIELFKKAADLGMDIAQIFLGEVYMKGEVLPKDYNKAFEYYRKAESSGNLSAIYNIGICYLKGFGVDQAPKKALDYFMLAAESDYPGALNMVGECYQNGWGITKNEIEAVKYYKKAIEKDDVNIPASHLDGIGKAQYNLGMCYLNGIVVAHDSVKAKELFEESQFIDESIYQLGLCYLNGTGTEKDEEQAENYISSAAIRGYTDAEYSLGQMYLSSKESYKKQKAREYLQKAAEKGHIGAMYELGQSFLNGTGGKKDYSSAANWLIKVSGSEDQKYAPLAQYSIGLIYYNGFGVTKDGKAAEVWFQKSLACGISNSYGMIGQIYYLGESNGLNVRKNVNIAATYLFDGYDKNDDISRKNLLSKRFVQQAIIGLSDISYRNRLKDLLSQVVKSPTQINEFAWNSLILLDSNAKKFLLSAIDQLK